MYVECLAYEKAGANVRVITAHRHGAPKKETFSKSIDVRRFQYFWPAKWQRLTTVNKPIYNHLSILDILQFPFLMGSFMLNILKHARWADTIHCQWTNTALLALPARWLFRSKIITTYRGSDIRLLPKFVNQFIFNNISGVIDNWGEQEWNQKIRERFKGNFIKLPIIVHNPEKDKCPDDMQVVLDKKPYTFKIVYVGRFERNMLRLFGLCARYLIDTAKLMKDEGRDFHVFLIGDGKEVKDEMLENIKKLGLEDCISFLGVKESVEDYIYFADIGIGGSAISSISQEISIYAKPQILTYGHDNVNVPWKDKENALFHEHESPESLRDALVYAMDNPEERKRIGENAQVVIQNYVRLLEEGGKLYLDTFKTLK